MSSIGDLANDIARWLYEQRIPVAMASILVFVLAVAAAKRLGWLAAARRHPARTGIVVLVVLAVSAPLGWYLGSPIFIRTSLVEPAPVASLRPVASPPTRSSSAPVVSTAPSAASSDVPAAPPTPIAFEPRTVTSGRFEGTDEFHFGSGRATIVEVAPDRFHLRLEDFSVRNGPDLYVYLSPDPDGYTDDALELGTLKATDGSFGYDLPVGTDPARFRSAIIWCKQFSHLFATATFEGT
ncbi:MAG TPA: DM13 domain-containing protein [Candidatus Saccharimonadales bacterium]|nr:DM13 domain-containing protein [Candidatus Saccharimonadales bacterium]